MWSEIKHFYPDGSITSRMTIDPSIGHKGALNAHCGIYSHHISIHYGRFWTVLDSALHHHLLEEWSSSL